MTIQHAARLPAVKELAAFDYAAMPPAGFDSTGQSADHTADPGSAARGAVRAPVP